MAKSKNGGAFQFLRGSIGSVTFSTSTMNVAGVRQQIARQKVTSVANPNTVGQIMQRMKVSPAQRFFAAINNADSTRLLEHSWEQLKYGNTGRLEFLRRALKADGPYVPKGVSRFIPAEYELSDGTLAAPSVVRSLDAASIFINVRGSGDTITAKDYMTAAAGGDANAQVTIIVVTLQSDGSYLPQITRWIPAGMADGVAPQGFPLVYSESANLYGTTGNQVALAVIVSKKDASGAWLRSPSKMVVSWALYNALYGEQALNEAIASYQRGGDNEYGSDWYLNLATGQPFNGSLTTRGIAMTALNGAVVVVGRQPVGQFIETSVFSVDGTSASQLVVMSEGECTVISSVTPTSIADALAYDHIVKWTPAMAAQIGYPQSAALEAALNPEPDPRP